MKVHRRASVSGDLRQLASTVIDLGRKDRFKKRNLPTRLGHIDRGRDTKARRDAANVKRRR